MTAESEIVTKKDVKSMEGQLVEYLRDQPGPVSRREVYRALHVAAAELDAVLKPLLKLRLVVEKNGKYVADETAPNKAK